MKWLIGVMIVVLVGCAGNVAIVPTPTIIIPIITPTLEPTATPVPLMLALSAERDELPADRYTRIPLTVHVTGREDIQVEGLTVYFNVRGGGSVEPSSLVLDSRSASVEYVAGGAIDRQVVTIEAVLDIPDYMRLRHDVTLALQRENIQVELACSYISTVEYTDIPYVLETDYPHLGGQYSLRFTLSGNGYLESWQRDLTQVIPTGIQSIRHQRSSPNAIGIDTLCIAPTDRTSDSRQCSPIIYSPFAQAIDIRLEREIARYLANPTALIEIRLALMGAGRVPLQGAGIIRYEVLLEPTPDALILQYDNTVFPRGICQGVSLAQGVSYFPYQTNNVPSVIRWYVETAGTSSVRDVMVGAQTLGVRNGAVFTLADGSTLTVNRAGAWQVVSTQNLDYRQPYTNVLLRFVVPDYALEDGQLSNESLAVDVYLNKNVTGLFEKAENNDINLNIINLDDYFAIDDISGRLVYIYGYVPSDYLYVVKN